MSADQWFVRLKNGSTITVSLDELDAGFQRGDIDENTLVFKHGMKEWLPLGEAAGLDDSADATQQDQAPVSAYPVSVSPVTVPQPTPSYVPVAQPDAYSVRPVAFDAPLSSYDASDLDLDMPRPSKKKKVIFALVAAAAVIGLGIAGVSSIKSVDPAAATASMPSPTQIQAAASPPPQAVTEVIPQAPSRLSDDQRKALMVQDDKLKTEQTKKAQDRATKAAAGAAKASRRSGKGKEPFVKGGSKYDPLNASL